jgi:hypothetical protein
MAGGLARGVCSELLLGDGLAKFPHLAYTCTFAAHIVSSGMHWFSLSLAPLRAVPRDTVGTGWNLKSSRQKIAPRDATPVRAFRATCSLLPSTHSLSHRARVRGKKARDTAKNARHTSNTGVFTLFRRGQDVERHPAVQHVCEPAHIYTSVVVCTLCRATGRGHCNAAMHRVHVQEKSATTPTACWQAGQQNIK